jgi:hypothetical protein
MSSPHNILSDLLRAFSSGGPGIVPLTATSAGVAIPDDRLVQLVVPTWVNSGNNLILPPATPGRIVFVAGGATGGGIRTSSPTTIVINGGTPGASARSAVAANLFVALICDSPTTWRALTITGTTVAGLPASA